MSANFLSDYIDAAIAASRNDFDDNHDVRRFGPHPPSEKNSTGWHQTVYAALVKKLGLVKELPAKAYAAKAVAHIAPHLADYEWLYRHLEDDESRRWLVQVQLYRALGQRQVKLPLNNSDYWSKLETVEKLASGAETMELGFNDWKAYNMRLESLGYPLEIFLPPVCVVSSMLLQQYRCQVGDTIIEVADGDIVIDAGGCYGDTAFYFAGKAGSAGKVYTFEFMPENLSIFHRNMILNPDWAGRIELVEKPLWDHSGAKLYIVGSGPGTRVCQDSADTHARQIETISIDDLVRDRKLPNLDFIKMDIEGAELQSLKGAEQSIRKYRPKLAISIYHKPDDFWTIPQYIEGLGLGYRFALRHFTIHQEETVLFAY